VKETDMRKLLYALFIVGLTAATPALAVKPDPVPPPNCSDVCWNLSYLYGSCWNGQTMTTCFYYLNA
jgi:hypothetical protein